MGFLRNRLCLYRMHFDLKFLADIHLHCLWIYTYRNLRLLSFRMQLFGCRWVYYILDSNR